MQDEPNRGRRARKSRETRQRIADAAIALFLKNGFDETTLDAISEAADISRRTFFHYFASKEAIVEALDDGLNEVFRDALKTVSHEREPLAVMQAALKNVVERYSSDEAAALHDLMYSTEALRARKQASYGRQERALYEALREIWPDPERSQGLEMVAIIGIGALRVAVDRWRAHPDRAPLIQQLDEAFDLLRAEIRDASTNPTAQHPPRTRSRA